MLKLALWEHWYVGWLIRFSVIHTDLTHTGCDSVRFPNKYYLLKQQDFYSLCTFSQKSTNKTVMITQCRGLISFSLSCKIVSCPAHCCVLTIWKKNKKKYEHCLNHVDLPKPGNPTNIVLLKPVICLCCKASGQHNDTILQRISIVSEDAYKLTHNPKHVFIKHDVTVFRLEPIHVFLQSPTSLTAICRPHKVCWHPIIFVKTDTQTFQYLK